MMEDRVTWENIHLFPAVASWLGSVACGTGWVSILNEENGKAAGRKSVFRGRDGKGEVSKKGKWSGGCGG